MAGTIKGSLKKKLGLKGKTKTGDMVAKMNEMKAGKAKTPKKTIKSTIKKTI